MRLLLDDPLPGAANMGRDEALLRAFEHTGGGVPVLRFYGWNPPTISLGYFQEYAEFESLAPPAGDLDVVRRTTGGGAILHDLEVTYSLTMPLDHPLIVNRPNRLYELAHNAVMLAIGGDVRLHGCGHGSCDSSAQRGPFFCFARRHALDVVVADGLGPEGVSKIAGSAQRRTRCAVLQHGSIILDSRFTQQPTARWRDLDPRIDFERAAARLRNGFEEVFERPARESAWRPDELAAAAMYESQYAGDDWTRLRKRLTA